MGEVRVVLEVKSLVANGTDGQRIEVMADTGASLTMLPAEFLARAGVKPRGRVQMVLADGRTADRAYGDAMIGLGGEETPARVVFGESGDAPLLGLTVLESAGFAVDPVNRRLIPSQFKLMAVSSLNRQVPVRPPPQLTAMGKPLDMAPGAFALMRESNDVLGNAAAERARMDEDGYLLLRGLLDPDRVLAARREMLERMQREGLLHDDHTLMEGVVRPGAHTGFKPELAKDNAALMEVLYGGPMISFFERFLGQPVRHYDYTWVRCVSRGPGTPPHYDIVYMGRGTWNLWTVWTPLGEVPWELGGLIVIPGTHKHERLKEVYAKRDVDTYCVGKPGTGWNAPGSEGWLSQDPAGVRRGLKAPWVGTEYRPGDVVVFSTVLVHAGLDNHTDRFRLSTDSRYQPASEPADERWIGANPPAHGANSKRGLIC